MLEWTSRFANKLRTPEEAIKSIKPGRRILIGSCAAEPQLLVSALITAGDHLADNEIVHLLTLGDAPYVEPGLERRFRHTAFFIGPNVRQAVQEGRADFMPVFLSEIPRLIRSRKVRIDVALIQVSPPDKHGYVSLGTSVDIVRAAVDCAELVIAEVNPQMPRTYGDSIVHVSHLAHLVSVDYALPEAHTEPLDEVCRMIGKNVASLVPDGATLQTGIGSIPHAVVEELGHRRNLGIHTEMLSDSVIDLVEANIVNGSRKTLLPGKVVTSFIMGTQRLYEWAHDNPVVEMRPSEFTNDPFVIARNDQMVAINSALAVDLTGQVAADTLKGRFFSGIGGQVDFIRGAANSRGGKPIIAFRSTAKDGQISRICAALDEGAAVVTSRGDVRYVVTEYGVADLWGKSIRQRAMALIDVAHPDFRGQLLESAKRKRYVFPDQVVPQTEERLLELESTLTLNDDTTVKVRPVRVTDQEPLQDLFYQLSDESTSQRFLRPKRQHPREEMQRLVDLDYQNNMGLLVCSGPPAEELVAMARYDVDPATDLADIALVVRDNWQGRGIATALMDRLIEVALARGVVGFTAEVFKNNTAMFKVLNRTGLMLTTESQADRYVVTLLFPQLEPPSSFGSVPPPPESHPHAGKVPTARRSLPAYIRLPLGEDD